MPLKVTSGLLLLKMAYLTKLAQGTSQPSLLSNLRLLVNFTYDKFISNFKQYFSNTVKSP